MDRLLAVVLAPSLDSALADGLRPSATAAHQLRADRLKQLRVRYRIAGALDHAIEAANGPAPPRSAKVPLDRAAVRGCAEELHALAVSVVSLRSPSAKGLAMAYQLAFDGGGPLFFQPDRQLDPSCLSNTVYAIESALRVSAEFDG